MTKTSPDYDSNFGSMRSSRSTRTPTPAALLPDDLNEIITDVDLQEEANRRLQEEKDAVKYRTHDHYDTACVAFEGTNKKKTIWVVIFSI